MRVDLLVSFMEKMGSFSFETPRERNEFMKIAQEVVPPMMGQDPSMMGMQDPSMMGMQDPSMMGMQGGGGMGIAPTMGAAPTPAAPMVTPAIPEELMLGESLTNSDIESFMKIFNIVTNLKTKYDRIKKEQLDAVTGKNQGKQ